MLNVKQQQMNLNNKNVGSEKNIYKTQINTGKKLFSIEINRI